MFEEEELMGGNGRVFVYCIAYILTLNRLSEVPLKLKMLFETSQFIVENIIMLCSVCGADIGQFVDSHVFCILD